MKQDASFDRKRHIFGAIMGPLCALLIWVTPIESLTPEQHRLLAVMAAGAYAVCAGRCGADEDGVRFLCQSDDFPFHGRFPDSERHDGQRAGQTYCLWHHVDEVGG